MKSFKEFCLTESVSYDYKDNIISIKNETSKKEDYKIHDDYFTSKPFKYNNKKFLIGPPIDEKTKDYFYTYTKNRGTIY